MIDYFALLQQPRKPWLEPDQLKEKYHELARRAQPDHNLNEAYRVLVDPKLRLQHLLNLEGGEHSSSSDEIPPELVELFMAIAPTLNKIDKQKATEVDNLLERAKDSYERALAEVRELNAAWELEQIEKLYRRLSYLTRWLELLAEQRFQLSI